MQIDGFDYFLLFSSSFVLVSLITPIMRKIALRIDFVDRPNLSHKTHKAPVPYLGGVAIIIGILIVSYSGVIIGNTSGVDFEIASSLLFPATLLGLVGLIDDRKGLSPESRFVAQTIAGIVTAVFLISTDTVGNPTGSVYLDALVTVLWVIGITNSINFFDNLDGGAAGTLAFVTFGLFVIAQSNGQFFIGALSVTTLGAVLGFLLWNKSPARIYMGDAGALFLGIVVSVLALRLDPIVNNKLTSLSIPLLLLAIPILDTSVAVVSRLRRGISPFQGGRDHLSHRLIRLGLSKRKTAYVLWSLSGFYCALGTSTAIYDLNANTLLIFSLFIWVILFIFFIRRPDV